MERGPRDRRQDQGDAGRQYPPHALTAIRSAKLPLGRRPSAILLIAVVALVALGYLELPGDDDGRDRSTDTPRPGSSLLAEVTRIVDGDTAVVEIGGREDRLRYIGIDTPESVQPGQAVECFGPESARRNAELVEGRQVRLEIGAEPRDRYDRLLAYVYVGKTMINAELLRGGYAGTLTIRPNDRYAARFERLEATARRAARGLWGSCR